MTCFADQASCATLPIIENEQIAKDTLRIRVSAPTIAQLVVPGQFLMLRNPAGNDPLIGRALALYDVSPSEGWIDLVYLVKGKLTTSVSLLKPGNQVAVWGPLGNGFPPARAEHLIMVAGGIGQTPFLTLAREALGHQQFGSPQRTCGYAQQVTFCYGVRSAAYLAGLPDFEQAGCDIRIATEDGSRPDGPSAQPERVTDVLQRVLDESTAASIRIVCCGPQPMMEAVALIADQRGIPCAVSLETPMACGIGICFTCVAKVGTSEDWDYKRTCVEGPVFNAQDILWH